MKRKSASQHAHDRRTEDLPFNARVRTLVVDDPYELGGRLTVTASIRNDPLGQMHARGHVDEAQYNAGRAYQRLCEQAEISRVKAMDPTKEPVDGGGLLEHPYNDGNRKAAKQLNFLEKTMGQEGNAIVRMVLCHNIPLIEIANIFGNGKTRERYFGYRFRGCLETIGIELNFIPRRRAC